MAKQQEARKPAQVEVGALELKGRLSELLSRVGFGKERVAITRHGKRIAWLVPAQDLEQLDGAA